MTRSQRKPVDLPPGPWRDLVDLLRLLEHTNRMDNSTAAQKAQMSPGHVSGLLNGRKPPTPDTAERLAAALGADPSQRLLARSLGERLEDLLQYERAKQRAAASPNSIDHWGIDIAYLQALDVAHHELRRVADRGGEDLVEAANAAVHNQGLYGAREQVLAASDPPVAAAAEAAFMAIIAVRNAVREGATLQSREYHAAYHRFTEAVWHLRLAVRGALGQGPLTPAQVGRADWTDMERCEQCRDRGVDALAGSAFAAVHRRTPAWDAFSQVQDCGDAPVRRGSPAERSTAKRGVQSMGTVHRSVRRRHADH